MFAFGDILNALGEFGRFQKWLVVLLSLPVPLTAFHMLGQVFMLVDVPHYCNTSWIRAVGPNLTEDELLNLTVPRGASGAYEQCSMYSPVDRDLDSIVAYGLNATQKCSNGWVYPSTQTPSLLTEFDLVCDKKDLNDISQAIYMLGLLLGAMIFGPLSDRIGRRPVILISMLIQGLFGVGIAFVPHFYVYMAFRCVVGASMSGITMTILALAMEWVGVSYRPHAVLVSHCCFAIGQMILAGLSYGIRNWRLLQIAGSVPIFRAPCRLGNSGCETWQAGGSRLRPSLVCPNIHGQYVISGDQYCVRSWTIYVLVSLCSFLRFANSLAYYGISLNVTNFGLDIYLTQLAFGAVEIPARASCILLLQWFGRKKCQGFLLLLSGLVCLIITGIPEDLPVVITVLAIIGKFATSASFSTSYVYTAELFPTVVRQTGVGLCSMSARVAGIIAPLIRLLARYHHSVPMAIFGSVPVLAGLLCFLLHETRGMDLVDDTSAAAPQHRCVVGVHQGTK
uniref:Solute carrier family 22 member 13-like n=1 Tax=Nothoprocta perdicaria TaxID=30464 RepID=A0A8C6Z8T5_NOTPE